MEAAADSLPPGCQRSVGSRRVRRLIASPTTLFTVRHLDGRSLAFRRARAIATELAAGFGAEITKVQRQAVERAAVLCAIAEDAATRRLAGQKIAMDEVLRAEAVAQRAVRAILAERPVKPAAARVLELRRQRWEADEKAKAAQAAQRETSSEQNPTESPDGREAGK
jgi:hypothetical protein